MSNPLLFLAKETKQVFLPYFTDQVFLPMLYAPCYLNFTKDFYNYESKIKSISS